MNYMDDRDIEKTILSMIKVIIDSNNQIPEDAKHDLKVIVDMESDPQRLLEECLLYMLAYHQ